MAHRNLGRRDDTIKISSLLKAGGSRSSRECPQGGSPIAKRQTNEKTHITSELNDTPPSVVGPLVAEVMLWCSRAASLPLSTRLHIRRWDVPNTQVK